MPLVRYLKIRQEISKIMYRSITLAVKAAFIAALLTVAVGAQTATTGTVNMSATVSKFVEINSGGAVTLAGTTGTGAGVTTDGTSGSPLAVVINLGELGPSNTNSFVTASVPLKLRSNAPYTLSVSSSVSSTGTSANKIVASDVGFGLGSVSRTGTGVNTSGTDTNATTGDPTSGGAVDANGRWAYATGASTLASFTSSTTALSGSSIMNAVPRSNTNGLTVPAIFAVKPQFYENGTTTVAVTFTVAAP